MQSWATEHYGIVHREKGSCRCQSDNTSSSHDRCSRPPCWGMRSAVPYCRMSTMERRSLVGLGTNSFLYHSSLKMKRKQGKERTMERCPFSGRWQSSSSLLSMPTQSPFLSKNNASKHQLARLRNKHASARINEHATNCRLLPPTVLGGVGG